MIIITNPVKQKLIEELAEHLLKDYGGDKEEREAVRESSKIERTRRAAQAIEFLNAQGHFKEDLNLHNQENEA